MKNTMWSKKVQSTELLYYSRAEKFNENNKDLWFDLLKVKNGQKILEVGCGGGHFTNMIKKFYPECQVYGIDIDLNHIEFAKAKAKELNINVEYMVADINALPFADEEFDLVFSHTVVEHLPFDNFIKEQKRVLKTNGNLVIMRVDMHKKVDRPFMYLEEEIGKEFQKMVIQNTNTVAVAQYLEETDLTMKHLIEYGFKNVDFKHNRVIYYMPDIANDQDVALGQIQRNYECKLYNALFNLDRADNGDELRDILLALLNSQYERRKEMYEKGEKIFDFQSSVMITISAVK